MKDINLLESLVNKYGKTEVVNMITEMKRGVKRENSAKDFIRITDADFESVQNDPLLADYEVTQNRNKTIIIRVGDTRIGYYGPGRTHLGRGYQLGYSTERHSYWVRYFNGDNMGVLDYKNGKYGFDTFDEAYEYLRNVIKKLQKREGTKTVDNYDEWWNKLSTDQKKNIFINFR